MIFDAEVDLFFRRGNGRFGQGVNRILLGLFPAHAFRMRSGEDTDVGCAHQGRVIDPLFHVGDLAGALGRILGMREVVSHRRPRDRKPELGGDPAAFGEGRGSGIGGISACPWPVPRLQTSGSFFLATIRIGFGRNRRQVRPGDLFLNGDRVLSPRRAERSGRDRALGHR